MAFHQLSTIFASTYSAYEYPPRIPMFIIYQEKWHFRCHRINNGGGGASCGGDFVDCWLVANSLYIATTADNAAMESIVITGKFKPLTSRFGSSSKEIKEKLLDEADELNTKKATRSALNMLNAYIAEKGYQELENTPNFELPDRLENFYVSARTKTNELYSTQSLKKHSQQFEPSL